MLRKITLAGVMAALLPAGPAANARALTMLKRVSASDALRRGSSKALNARLCTATGQARTSGAGASRAGLPGTVGLNTCERQEIRHTFLTT